MLARMLAKFALIALVGTAWLGSYVSCDTGSIYGRMGGYDTGYYDSYDTFSVGGYVVEDPGYYGTPVVNDYYDPYLDGYYDGYGW